MTRAALGAILVFSALVAVGAAAVDTPVTPPVSAAPAMDSTVPAAPAVDSTAPATLARRPAPVAPAPEEFAVTVPEVQALVSRGESPRLRVTNRFKRTVTGRAVGFEKGKLLLDVTGEGLGVDGVLGVEVASIASMAALVPMTETEKEAARQSTAQYLAGINAGPQVPGPSQAPSPSGAETPGTGTEPVAGTIAGAGADRDLLSIYPPSEGWGPTRLAEITRKAVVLHLEPAGKEKEFLKDYDLWRGSYERKRLEQVDELARLQAAGATVPADFKVLPELEPVPALEGAVSPAPSVPVGDEGAQAPSPAPTGQ